MHALEILLERLAAPLIEANALPIDGPPSLETIQELCETIPAMVTLHSFKRKTAFVYLNDLCRDFYGFAENDVSTMGLTFYLKTFHPGTFTLLPHSYQFFANNRTGYLPVSYQLKNASGKYEKVRGVSRTLVCDSRGKTAFIISITCREADWLDLSSIVHFKLEDLKTRHKLCLRYLLHGHTNSEIADFLNCSVKTVEAQVSSIFKAAGIKTRRELLNPRLQDE